MWSILYVKSILYIRQKKLTFFVNGFLFITSAISCIVAFRTELLLSKSNFFAIARTVEQLKVVKYKF